MTLSRLGMHVLKLRLTLIRIGLSKIFAGTLCIVGLIAWVWAFRLYIINI